MSLSDPLTLLRDFTVAKKPVVLKDDNIVFGNTLYARKTLTAYRSGLSGSGAFYALDSLWFLLQQKSTPHGQYVAECGRQGITAVSLPDKRNLISFLEGKLDSSPSVDFANAPAVQPIVVPAEGADASAEAQDDAMDVVDAEADLGLADEDKEAAEAAKAEEKRRLQAALETSKAAFAALLEQPRGNVAPAAGEAEAGAVEEPAAGAAEGEAEGEAAGDDSGRAGEPAKPAGGGGAAKAAKPRAFALGEAKAFVRDKSVVGKTKAIMKKEQRLRSRKSVLLAPTTPSFPLVSQILDNFRKRSKLQLEHEEKQKRAEHHKQPREGGAKPPAPGAPGVPGAPSSAPGAPSGGPSRAAAAPPPPRGAPHLTPSHHAGGASPRARDAAGVIVVPATLTYLVNMWNVRELLQERVLVDCMEKRAAGAQKEACIRIRHTFEDGSSAAFVITDNPLALKNAAGQPVPTDWSALVAVFAAGNAWQFKGWPYKDATELFNKVQGYHLRFSDEKPNQIIKQWPVEKLMVSKQKTKAHEVSVMVMKFWSTIHQHMMRHKPHMVSRPLARQASM